MPEPKVTINLSGGIADFTRIDNVYTAIKREAPKLLKDWTLSITVDYKESQSGG